MADFSLKNVFKKVSDKLCSKNCVTLVKSFDTTLGICPKGKNSKPIVSVNANGSVDISLFKLILIILGVFALFSIINGFVKMKKAFMLKRYRKRAKLYDDEMMDL